MDQAADIPAIESDETLAFLREGYDFISSRCDRLDSDIFRTRLMMQPVTCVRGAEAAEMFYGDDHFTRRNNAMPPTVLRLLQDKGSVQQLDDEAHRRRKAMFVSLVMNEVATAAIVVLFRDEFRKAMADWAARPTIILLDEAYLILTRAIYRWMEIPLSDTDAPQAAYELSSMVENAGSVGPSVVAALMRRRQSERRIERLVEEIRTGRADIGPTAPVAVIALHREEDGSLLPTDVAAVEILNILRPVAAIARYIMFAAMALNDHPSWCHSLYGADKAQYGAFSEEVRRLYPFFPLIGGKVRAPFSWHGHDFDEGEWVLLDLHGTNHDPRRFQYPDEFHPDRDISWRNQGFDFVPQGGGDARRSHRCPGEEFTVALIGEATRFLVEEVTYEVPEQDLTISLGHMPARPVSGMILAEVRPRAI